MYRIVFKWLFAILALMCIVPSYARTSRYGDTDLHYIGVSATGGCSWVFSDCSNIKTYGRPSASFGVDYELIHHKFLFRTGLEAQLFQVKSSYQQPFSLFYPIQDMQGKSCTMRYDIAEYYESDRMIFMELPIMFGYSHPKGFFVMGGVRLGLCTYARAETNLTYSTVGIYGEYIDEFSNMPNHSYLIDSKADLSQSLSSKFMATGIFEIGYDVLSPTRSQQNTHCHRLELSLFAELGMNSPYKSGGTSTNIVEPVQENATQLKLNCLYGSLQDNSSHILPFNAGFRIAFFFKVSDLKSCNCSF